MNPPLVKARDRQIYESMDDHDLLVRLSVKVDDLEDKINEHCESSRFNITTIIAIAATIIAVLAIFVKV